MEKIAALYPLNDTLAGDNRIYGEFPNCELFGDACTFRITRCEDFDPRVLDILGNPSFGRGGMAIHISGLDSFGHKDGFRHVEAIGIQEVIWAKPGHHCSGTGCSQPDPVVILGGPSWMHFANWSDSRYFVTLEGVRQWANGHWETFTAETILAHINSTRPSYLSMGAQQGSAIRRLLDAGVGEEVSGARLARAGGRWKFRWDQVHDATKEMTKDGKQ